jgi:hypothetical protein
VEGLGKTTGHLRIASSRLIFKLRSSQIRSRSAKHSAADSDIRWDDIQYIIIIIIIIITIIIIIIWIFSLLSQHVKIKNQIIVIIIIIIIIIII